MQPIFLPKPLRSLLILYLILGLIVIALVSMTLSRAIRIRKVEDTLEMMDVVSVLVAASIEERERGFEDPGLSRYLKEFGKQNDIRLTLIDESGEVIADSTTGSRDIGPHATRTEILLAGKTGTGHAERYSATLDRDMLYFARAYPALESRTGYIRVSVPADEIDGVAGAIRPIFWISSCLALALSLVGIAIFFSHQFAPIRVFTDAVRKVSRGEFQRDSEVRSCQGIWSEMANEFEKMKLDTFERETGMYERAERLEAVLSSMIEGVLAIDSQGGIMLANRAARQMFGLSMHESLRDKKFLEVVRIPELRDAVERTQLHRMLSESEFETLFEPKRRLHARVSVLPSENQPGIAVVLHDVTELRQLETIRRDFVANVSHELKTPLASIKAYAETLKLGAINDTDNNIQFVDRIESEAVQLEHQILDLLELAKVESGEAAFQLSDFSLNEACQECYYQFEQIAIESQLQLELKLFPGDLTVQADKNAIQTILANLVINAIHYTPAGGTVTLETMQDEGHALVRVIDTGIGIAPDQQRRIFERFYRVDRARSRDRGGTGLGLAIVKHLTQQFGGNVNLQSQIGKGSTFTVSLPRVTSHSKL